MTLLKSPLLYIIGSSIITSISSEIFDVNGKNLTIIKFSVESNWQ